MNDLTPKITALKEQLKHRSSFTHDSHSSGRLSWIDPVDITLIPDNIKAQITASDNDSLMLSILGEQRLTEGNYRVLIDEIEIPIKAVLIRDNWHAFSNTDEGRGLIWLLHKTQLLGPQASSEPKATTVLSKIPGRGQYSDTARQQRLKFLQDSAGLPEEFYQNTCFQAEELQNNVENFIGSVEIPVGVAGPLIFNGQQVQGEVYAPIATTEGALVATISKGAQNISRAGGVKTRVLDHRMMRVPVFDFDSIEDSELFIQWVNDHIEEIRLHIKKYSNHAKLVALEPHLAGVSVHLEFIYTTGDASGQNMTTTCTWNTCKWMVKQLSYIGLIVKDYMVEGNLSSDKKVSYKSFIKGRGIRVLAEAHISDKDARNLFHIRSDDMVTAYHRVASGSIQSGMVGMNMNVANLIGGIFTATGQDIACVHESSTAHLHIEKTDTGFYASMLLPSLVIATIGGGTQLSSQQAGLSLLGCSGAGKVYRLAEIIAGFSLGLDLCSLSAIDNGRFTIAHEQLGRNKPMNPLKFTDFNNDFFAQGLQQYYGSADLVVNAVEPITTELGSSIITGMLGGDDIRPVGHFPFAVAYDLKGESRSLNVMVKSKPLDTEFLANLAGVAQLSHSDVATLFPEFVNQLDLVGCHKKELGIYRQDHADFVDLVPAIYRLYENDSQQANVVVMAYFDKGRLLNTEMDTSVWNSSDIEIVFNDLARLHSIHFNKTDSLDDDLAVSAYQDLAHLQSVTPFFHAMSANAFDKFDWYTEDDLALRTALINDLPQWRIAIDTHPKTLIHNDFNARNLFIDNTSEQEKICVYDWELAKIHIPQHDLVEFLMFVLQPNQFDKNDVEHWLEYYRQRLQETTNTPLDESAWRAGFVSCIKEYSVYRLGLYMMVHAVSPFGFVERVFTVSQQLLAMFSNER